MIVCESEWHKYIIMNAASKQTKIQTTATTKIGCCSFWKQWKYIPRAINWQEGEMSVKNNVNILQSRRSDESIYFSYRAKYLINYFALHLRWKRLISFESSMLLQKLKSAITSQGSRRCSPSNPADSENLQTERRNVFVNHRPYYIIKFMKKIEYNHERLVAN